MTIDRDLLLDYVMGSLTPEQELEVAAHLNAHPEEAAWVRDMFETLAAVALAQDPAEVPDGAEDALLQRVRSSTPSAAVARLEPAPVTLPREPAPRRSRSPWVALALAAALAVVAWLGLRPALETYQVAQRLDRLCAEAGVRCETLASDGNEPLGTLAVRPDNSLYVVFDRSPPAGQVYQAWEIVGGTPQSLGTSDERVLDIARAVSSDSTFGVSLEPPGGSAQPTSTPIVVLPLTG